MISIQDIARQMNLSVSTVYKAFNGGKDISEQTRNTILKVASDMGYINKPRPVTRKRVCVFLEHMELVHVTYYLYEIVLAFKKAAAQNGFEVVIRSLEDDDQLSYDQVMKYFAFEGGLVLGLNTKDRFFCHLQEVTQPCVIIDNYIDNPHVSCIIADNVRGMGEIVKYLLDIGHKRIGFINGEQNSITSAERLSGFISATTLGGIAYSPSLIMHGDFSEQSGACCAVELLKHEPSALCCASDLMAIGAIRELQSRGIRVPEDISVTGFDDIRLARYISPGLTTIHVDVENIGMRAFSCLMELMNGGSCAKILEAPRLVVRGSSAQCFFTNFSTAK